jgi:YHS domain-containing protein
MNFLSRIIRYVFWVVVVAWGFRLLRWFIGRMLGGANQPQAGSAVPATDATANSEGMARKLVRDPVCGMHVAEVLAIPLREGSEMVHFCSVQCRDRYAASTRKFAANG